MPFYEAVGQDTRSHKERTIHISARNDQDAVHTAADQGVVEIKLRAFTERELLMMDTKCFLYADPMTPIKAKPQRIGAQYPRSILFDHPIPIITGSVFAALLLNRAFGFLLTLL